MSPRSEGLACVGIALGLALGVALLGPDAEGGMQILTMLTPAAAVLVMRRVAPHARGHHWSDLGLGTAGLRSWPAAVGLPLVVVGSSYLAAAAVHPVSWSTTAGTLLQALAGIPVVAVLVALEEVCWRGYVLPRLGPVGAPRPAALVGLLHGIWHLPLILLTTAYHPVGSRLVVVPVFLAMLTSAGVVYGWLRGRSRSVWPVVVAHTTFNVLLGIGVDGLDGTASAQRAFGRLAGETGVLTLLAVVVVAVVVVGRARRRPVRPVVSGATPAFAAVAGALVLLVLGAGGGAVAATAIGSAQIRDNSIRSRDLRDGSIGLRDLSPATQARLRVAAAARTTPWNGPGGFLAASSTAFVFAGPSVVVTTDAIHPRISGVAVGSFAVVGGSGSQYAAIDLCSQVGASGELVPFTDPDPPTQLFATTRATYAASASVARSPGAYRVGLCIRNDGGHAISSASAVSGWVQASG